MRQRLVHAAHDPKADMLRASLHKAWDDGVKGTLPSHKSIRRFCIQRKQAAAILQDKAPTLHRDRGAKGRIVALNQRKNIALAINDREISRIAARERARSNRAIRLAGIDQPGALRRKIFRQQLMDWDLAES